MADDSEPSTDLACVPSEEDIRFTPVDVVYGKKPLKQLRQYILGELLGKGSYAKVKEGVDTTSWRRVAIKIINKRQLRRVPHGVESVEQEIQIQRSLSHPNCVRLLESFSNEEKGKLYIVLEYMSGGALQDLLDNSNKKLPLGQARSFFRDMIEGLQYTLESGILHRDIKPGNLMLSTEGTLKISDFGCAEYLETYDGKNVKSQGSPAFQPPEIASGSHVCSGTKVDIWAAGVTLYFLVTGSYPFKGTTVYNLFANIASGEYELSDRVNSQAADLIHHMLDPNFEERYSIEQIKSHEFWSMEIADDIEDFLPIPSQPTIFEDDEQQPGKVLPVSLEEEPDEDEDDDSIAEAKRYNRKKKSGHGQGCKCTIC